MRRTTRSNVQKTVAAMLNEIGLLGETGLALDDFPPKLHQVRQLLRELEADLEEQTDRAKYGVPGATC